MSDILARIRAAYMENPAKAIDMLPEFFQAMEDGEVIGLPCKVGDTVFVWSKTIPAFEAEEFDEDGIGPDFVQGKIVSIRQNSKGWFIKFSVCLHWKTPVFDDDCGPYDAFFLKGRYFTFSMLCIGKTVFLSRVEAAAALALLKGEKK
jgi:hypothetical protein